MSKNEAQSEPTEDVLRRIEASLDKQGKEIKGIKGQQGLIRARIGMGRPGESQKEPESSPSQALASETKPQEAPKNHFVRAYEKVCPDCGEPNESYKKPNAFCADCGVPLGSFKDQAEAAEKVKQCWNCESSKGKWKD